VLSNGKGIWKYRHLISSILEGVSQSCIFKSGSHTQTQWIAVGRRCISVVGLARGRSGNGLQVTLQIFLICLQAVCKRGGGQVHLGGDGVAEGSLPQTRLPVPAGCSCWCCRTPPVSLFGSLTPWRTAPGFAGWVSGVGPRSCPGCIRVW